jgi:hypothetical protein
MTQNKQKLVAAAVGALITLLLLVRWPGLRVPSGGQMIDNADHAPAETYPPGAVHEQRPAHDFGLPDEWFVAGAVGQTYTETLSGADLRIGETSVLLGQSPPDGPYVTVYAIGRAYAGWNTSILPDDANVLSATLSLELPAGGGWEEPLDIVIYQGTWTPTIDLDAWLSPCSQAVGYWHLSASQAEEREKVRTGQGITLYAPEPARTARVPLDPAVVEVDGVTRVELRHAGEGVPPTLAEVVTLERSLITLEVVYQP